MENNKIINEKSEKIKVSVIIPVFNAEKYLKKCLNSVLNQTLTDIEIICINDGSTDNSIEILTEYSNKDDRIKLFDISNHGQGYARNIALKEARGEYISFVDADDWIREDSLQLLYYKSKFDDLDVLFFQLINYMQDSKKYKETDLYNHICFENNGINEDSIFNHHDTSDYLFEIPVCPVSKLYKKSFLEKNKLYFPEGFYFEDNYFFYHMYLMTEKVGFLKEHLYFRRRHDSSLTFDFNIKQFDIVKATNAVINMFKEINAYETYKKSLINHTYTMIRDWFKRAPLEYREKFYQLIKNNFIGLHELHDDFESNLIQEYLIIFNLFDKNDYYLDFDSEYKLCTVNYTIFDGISSYERDSEIYKEYKLNKTKNNYLISIIIPVYNTGKIIHRTLLSIENQTIGFENLEVLLINDNSNDFTSNIINSYAKKYVNVDVININKSTGSSGTPRNIGIIESTSEYLMFLDHDDFFEVDALEKLFDEMNKNNSDVVFGTYSQISNHKVTKIQPKQINSGFYSNIDSNEKIIAIPPPSIWTKLFKKIHIQKNKVLFPTILGEDAIFLSKVLINANGITYLKEENICFHDLMDSSTTNNISLKYLTQGLVSEKYMYNYYKNIGKENYYKIRGSSGIISFYLNQFYKSKLKKEEYKKIFPLMRDFLLIHNKLGNIPNNVRDKTIYYYILHDDEDSFVNFKLFIDGKKLFKENKMVINKKKLDKLKEKVNYLEKNIDRIKKENIKTKEKLSKIKKENKELNKFKKEVLNSSSWKITEPLRNLKN